FNLNFGTQIFKSFSDESRTRILNLLFHFNELTISDLVMILDFTQTKTSRHMSFLKNAGVVSARNHDQWIFYSIRDEAYNMVNQIVDFLEKDAILQNDLQTYETLKSNRELSANKVAAKDYYK
ncbi:MAG: metalloregulator ArsR/SmtB family transcription factor, partial [Cytophagales bacterium]|nr:metalloregulator ArsR/SmtB family transcription factor [Cytophagales bacterium]